MALGHTTGLLLGVLVTLQTFIAQIIESDGVSGHARRQSAPVNSAVDSSRSSSVDAVVAALEERRRQSSNREQTKEEATETITSARPLDTLPSQLADAIARQHFDEVAVTLHDVSLNAHHRRQMSCDANNTPRVLSRERTVL